MSPASAGQAPSPVCHRLSATDHMDETLNLYESARSKPSFNKLEIGDLLFAEYTGPVGTAKLASGRTRIA